MVERTIPEFECKLADYFRERLQHGAESLAPPPQTETLWYMGALLARLGDSRQLFSYENGTLNLRPLALLYKDAHEARAGYERCLILRQLGDQALFIGALFPERYERKGIKQDYFIGMGGGAYDYLAGHVESHRSIFKELSERFAAFLELVAEACTSQVSGNVQELLMLYQQWRRTGSKRLAKQLASIGLDVADKKALH